MPPLARPQSAKNPGASLNKEATQVELQRIEAFGLDRDHMSPANPVKRSPRDRVGVL